MPNYELWLTTDTGVRLALLDHALGGYFWRVTNGAAQFSLSLPADFDIGLLTPDRMLQIWRAPTGGRLSLWNVYLVRAWTFARQGDRLSIEVRGPDVNDLLRRRHVINYAGTAGATKTDYADDMMKEIVTQHLVADASAPAATAGSRNYSRLTVQSDLSDGPTLSVAFAWRNVLDTLQDIANAAKAAGTEVFFGIVPATVTGSSITLQFQTRTAQPGQDLTGLGAVFDEARGNLGDPAVTYDYQDEVNYVYAGGQGEKTARNIQQVYDAARYAASIWNRCEGFAHATSAETDNAIREAGRAKLVEGEPVISFRARLIDTEGFRFGRDWNWGDRITARFLGQDYDAIVRKVGLNISADGGETIDARLDNQE